MQKAKSKKKKFIDPKNEQTQTFAVIHRSQKDPLAADSDAPQRLLQPIPESKAEAGVLANRSAPGHFSTTEAGKKGNKDKEREFGIFYDDQYDYLQHMKTRDEFLSDNVLDEFTLEAPVASVKPARYHSYIT